MKRIFIFMVAFLLCFSFFRIASGHDPLSLSSFLNVLSDLDFDFDTTSEVLRRFAAASNSIFDSDVSVLEKIFACLFQIWNVLSLVVAVFADVCALLISALRCLSLLLGEAVFGPLIFPN